jgi:hypothetical protein
MADPTDSSSGAGSDAPEDTGQTREADSDCRVSVIDGNYLTCGFFFSNGAGYFANSSAHYCLIDSWTQWLATHGPVYGAQNLTILPTMIYDGECKLPAGYFFNDGTGYYANSSGHYCAFTSWDQWIAAGGPGVGYPTFVPIPSSMTYDGVCGQSPVSQPSSPSATSHLRPSASSL